MYIYIWYIRLQKEKQFETSNQVVFSFIFLGVEKYVMKLDNVQLGSLRTDGVEGDLLFCFWGFKPATYRSISQRQCYTHIHLKT